MYRQEEGVQYFTDRTESETLIAVSVKTPKLTK